MESCQTSRTVEKGGRDITVYDRHSTRKSVEVTLKQWQKFDCENYKINRREEEKLEYSGLSDEYLKKYLRDSEALRREHVDRPDEIPAYLIGSAIGSHIGPNAVGVAFFSRKR